MIKFEMHETLPNHVIDRLWEQKVDMDDWDYVLFVEDEYRTHFRECVEDGLRGNMQAKSYEVECLLHGCCYNAWYSIDDFFARKGILGVAYHA